jgi:RNA polymerase sigma factor FliA
MLTEELWVEYVQSREPQLREKLILQYAPLVRYVMGRLAISFPIVMDRDDVYNCGVIGLIHAVDRFEPCRDVKFETYAISRIRGAIIDELRTLDPMPRSLRRKGKDIEQAYARLQETLGRPATDAEVAEHLGMDLDALNGLMFQLSKTTVSLDSALEGEEGGESLTLADLIEDESSPNPTDLYERRELTGQLASLLGEAPERERLVLALYYYDELTLREISKVMDISESRVCQLHTRAVLRIRALLNSSMRGSKSDDRVRTHTHPASTTSRKSLPLRQLAG